MKSIRKSYLLITGFLSVLLVLQPVDSGTVLKLKLPKFMSGGGGGGGGVMQLLAAGIVVKMLQGLKLPELNLNKGNDAMTMVTPMHIPTGMMMTSMMGWPSNDMMMGGGWPMNMMTMDSGWNTGGMMNSGWSPAGQGMMTSGWNPGGMMNSRGKGRPMMGNMGD